MLKFNLDECLFYVYDEDLDKDTVINKNKILSYMDYPINFESGIAQNFTLRKFRSMLNGYPHLLLPYITFNDFLSLTSNIGFKIVNNNECFEKIIIGKTFNIRKSELTLLAQEIVEEKEKKISFINGLKITRAKFIRTYKDESDINVRIDCYAKGKTIGKKEYYSLSTEKIIDLYDLPIEISNDRYIEYFDKSNKERAGIEFSTKVEDKYLSDNSITLKDLLDAIDLDIEFWDDTLIDELNTSIKEQSKKLEDYIVLEKENKERLDKE